MLYNIHIYSAQICFQLKLPVDENHALKDVYQQANQARMRSCCYPALEKRSCAIHELALTEAVLKVVLKYAEENKAHRIVSIQVQVGELRDFTEEWMQHYFDYLSRGTIAEGGKIALKSIPLTFKCFQCADSFNADIRQDKILCPVCGCDSTELVSGREFTIESIEVI